MPEWIAIALTILLAMFVLWVVIAILAGAMTGDIYEGLELATVMVIALGIIAGVAYGAISLGMLIWSGVPS